MATIIKRSGFNDNIVETRRALDEARHLPGYIYNSPEVFAREKERIFMTDWLCMGRVEQFSEPGDYRTFDIMGDPIAVVRGADNKFNAFSNLCAHRGVEVVPDKEGNAERFKCPYHAWTYDLEGKLLGAPRMKEHPLFDPKSCRLEPLQVDTWAGWIFVNFDMEAPALNTKLEEFAADFGFLDMENLKLGPSGEGEVGCNWKYFVENIVDEYHVAVAHKDTIGRFMTNSSKWTLRGNGGYKWEYDAGPSTPTGKPLFNPLPVLKDEDERYSISGFAHPNLTLFGRIDSLSVLVTWPISPEKTRVASYSLFSEEQLADPEFEAKMKARGEITAQTFQEDAVLIASLQRASMSSRFKPGYMASPEVGIHHLINYYLDRMSDDNDG